MRTTLTHSLSGTTANVYYKSIWFGQEVLDILRDLPENEVFSVGDLTAVHFASVWVSVRFSIVHTDYCDLPKAPLFM